MDSNVYCNTLPDKPFRYNNGKEIIIHLQRGVVDVGNC